MHNKSRRITNTVASQIYFWYHKSLRIAYRERQGCTDLTNTGCRYGFTAADIVVIQQERTVFLFGDGENIRPTTVLTYNTPDIRLCFFYVIISHSRYCVSLTIAIYRVMDKKCKDYYDYRHHVIIVSRIVRHVRDQIN